MTTLQDIAKHEATGPWRGLLETADHLVRNAESLAGFSLRPLFGGGTRLMLDLHHRISDDIDLFIRDPQWIGYLTPRLNESVEAIVDAYEENAVSLKLKFKTGEIDFIVAMSLLNLPSTRISNIGFELEPVAEVLAKKLFYRGSLLTPRDLFDWWAIEQSAPHEVPHDLLARLLKDRLKGIETAVGAMGGSAQARLIWESLRAPVKPAIEDAVRFAQQRLSDYRDRLDRTDQKRT